MPTKTHTVDHIAVAHRGGTPCDGVARFAGQQVPCRLGRNGISRLKREGDGTTPAGCYPVLGGFYRADRLARPRSGLDLQPLTPDDGWCDDPDSPRYNRFVTHPFDGSAERLWRDDHLYDVVLVIGHNTGPTVKGAGSAIFLHVAAPDGRPTEGCIAFERDTLLRLVARIVPGTMIEIA